MHPVGEASWEPVTRLDYPVLHWSRGTGTSDITFLFYILLLYRFFTVWDTNTCSLYLNKRSIWKEWEQFVLLVWNFCSVVFLNKVFYIYSKIVFHLLQSLRILWVERKVWCSSDVSRPNLWLALELWWSVPTLKEKRPLKAQQTRKLWHLLAKNGSLQHEITCAPLRVCVRELLSLQHVYNNFTFVLVNGLYLINSCCVLKRGMQLWILRNK